MALKPWREVVVPHPDVAEGRYRQAEFAADLAQVLAGRAAPEYQDPVEFFARTYLTEGMIQLLKTALLRLSGRGGEPVVELKTAFGGGKTHTMLALYHLLGGKATPDQMAGADRVMAAAGVEELPKVRFAVLAGTALDPNKPEPVDGGEVRTLWGRMAFQIGGPIAFSEVAQADVSGVSPGADTLVKLFDAFGPCVVLMDELVAYVRNLYGVERRLPSGTFESNMTFVQNLTEAVKRSRNSMLVASIPESKIEAGGPAGEATLERLEHTLGRLEAVWKPVGASEGFEIVRRRLFMPIQDKEARDEVCRAFSRMYSQTDAGDFPPECRESGYLERLRASYPIHPEVFDRLYDDWSSLERFQRTRGVLRLMAAVIHELWMRGDQSLMILPGMIPMDSQPVRDELLRYLPEGWATVVDRDVDGDRSEPSRVDRENSRFGILQAARRVSRTIFLGSAPSVRQQNVRGIEDIRVRLGAMQPGESVAVFNDALGRLRERLTYLYSGSRRYWYDTRPNLRRTVEERAAQLDDYEVRNEIERRVKAVRERGTFGTVHAFPASADVSDEQSVRLVVLPPEASHRKGRMDSPAISAAAEILQRRGNIPRSYKNMLVFLAPDAGTVSVLESAVRQYLAWASVVRDTKPLNLDEYQREQAAEGVQRSDETVELQLQEAYCWLLVPTQNGTDPVVWEENRLAAGQENFVTRAARKLESAGELITRWGPELLRRELDRWLWKDTPHVGVKVLWDDLTRYLYFPRLKDESVLLQAIQDGLSSQTFFGYAASVTDDGRGGSRYEGLQFGTRSGSVYLNDQSVLVKPEVAARQLQEEESARQARMQGGQAGGAALAPGSPGAKSETGGQVPGDIPASGGGQRPAREDDAGTGQNTALAPRRFHGSVELNANRLALDADRVATEVVQHLAALLGSRLRITLEISAEVPDGVPGDVVRIVTENCRALHFRDFDFEEE